MPQQLQAVLTAQQLSKTYLDGERQVSVLKSLDMAVGRGERIAIIGQSGAGKSTLLNLLGGLDLPSSGKVTIAGQDLFSLGEDGRAKLRNKQLGFVYQFHHLLPEFSALENVAMPLLIAGEKPEPARHKAENMLASVGLQHRLEHKPAQLSGGERQRVAIARALITHPACVLMDEPTGNLDKANGEAVLQLIDQLSRDMDISFVVVTHDQQVARRMDRVLLLEGGTLNHE